MACTAHGPYHRGAFNRAVPYARIRATMHRAVKDNRVNRGT